jgi:two-component system LytT family sensor kinase
MDDLPRRTARQLAGQTWRVLFGLAVFAGTIDLLNHLIVSALGSPVSFWWTFFKTVVWWVSYIPLLALAFLVADRYRLDREDRRRNLFIHLSAALAFAYVHTASNALLDPQWLTTGVAFLPRMFRIVRGNFPIDFISYWAIVGITYAFHYYSELHQRELAAAQLKTTTAQLEASLAEARLRALRSQLNPHFLFNTLNAVSTLALRGEARAVSRMLSRLSALLRVSLDEGGPQVIQLSKELQFLNSYLEIQQMWFGDRLTVHRQIAPETLDALVPTMILQPLIENAIVHGVAHQGAGSVRIEAASEDEMLRLTVTDSGPGFASTFGRRSGIGLSNTEARLGQLYGQHHQIEYGRSREGGALVTLRIPFVSSSLTAAASA